SSRRGRSRRRAVSRVPSPGHRPGQARSHHARFAVGDPGETRPSGGVSPGPALCHSVSSTVPVTAFRPTGAVSPSRRCRGPSCSRTPCSWTAGGRCSTATTGRRRCLRRGRSRPSPVPAAHRPPPGRRPRSAWPRHGARPRRSPGTGCGAQGCAPRRTTAGTPPAGPGPPVRAPPGRIASLLLPSFGRDDLEVAPERGGLLPAGEQLHQHALGRALAVVRAEGDGLARLDVEVLDRLECLHQVLRRRLIAVQLLDRLSDDEHALVALQRDAVRPLTVLLLVALGEVRHLLV